MNILVIGNGFDLAHGLPTRYGDFLEFCEKVKIIYRPKNTLKPESYEKNHLSTWKTDEKIKKDLQEAFASRKGHGKSKWDTGRFETKNPILNEFYSMIKDNLWVDYFNQCNMNGKENWIDFETEIANVIRSIENDMSGDINGTVTKLENGLLSNKYFDDKLDFGDGKIQYINFFELRDILLHDLNRLIRAFEIYLCDYIEKKEIREKSPDVDALKIDYVLSFNYTHTFSKLYKTSFRIKKEGICPFNYIHGEANIENTLENNNMVLGIDEYLCLERRNEEIDFIAFKKYYQRIYKGTGCEYKEWLFELKEKSKSIVTELRHQYPIQIPFIKFTNDTKHNLYIFGHSLDVTDKDILRDLILNDNVYTTIFYFSKKDLGSKIANLVKVIGQEELVEVQRQ